MTKKQPKNQLTSTPDDKAGQGIATLDLNKPLPNFTPKEQKFLKGYVEEVIPGNKTKRDLAMEVYPKQSARVASVTAHENLSKPKFKDALALAFEQAGITPMSLAQTFSEAMYARKTAQVGGEIIESSIPDHSVRVNAGRAAAMLLKENDKGEQSGGLTLNFNNGTQNFVANAEIKAEETQS